jgi:heterodisulfide reductase subunit D
VRKMAITMDMLMYTCPRCKTCTGTMHPGEKEVESVCPAFTRYKYFTYAGGGKCYTAQGLLEGALQPDEDMAEVIYHCTLCKACSEQCAAHSAEPSEIARQVRRELVAAGFGPPEAARGLVKSVQQNDNPYGAPRRMRGRWARKLGLKDASSEKVETLYFVGCTADLIPARNHFAENTVGLLKAAGVDFGTLGENEFCCGATVFNLGCADVFEEVARRNIERLNSLGVERIVTSCAGCYSILAHAYPEVAKVEYQVLSTPEYLDQLMQEGRLKPSKPLDLKVTYHDPCHLGRYCGVYDEPRRVLERLPGVELVEMRRNREKSWCCGAGAGVKTSYPDFALWIGEQRVREALETGAQALVSACPFCEGNLADTVEAMGADIKVMDLTDLVLRSLE